MQLTQSQRSILYLSGFQNEQLLNKEIIHLKNHSQQSFNRLHNQSIGRINGAFQTQSSRQIFTRTHNPSPTRYQSDQSLPMDTKHYFKRGQSFQAQDGSNVSIMAIAEKKIKDRFELSKEIMYRANNSIGLSPFITKQVKQKLIQQHQINLTQPQALNLAQIIGIPRRIHKQQ
uniref:Uncharacterized protein n=1 Tax=Spironucleus salmonicida TaxID=348837 RepID=V6LRN0_9EUKA|eukprot:EST47220.1 Hypothetical protein SS50377_12731 [Spironucleus salmonicida]